MSRFNQPDRVLYLCTGGKCSKRGGKHMYKVAKSFVKHHHLHGALEVLRTECTDNCDYAPVCALQPDNIWLKEYSEKDVLRLLKVTIQG